MTGDILAAALIALCGVVFALARTRRTKVTVSVAALGTVAAGVFGIPTALASSVHDGASDAVLASPFSMDGLSRVGAVATTYRADNAAGLDKFGEMFGQEPADAIGSLMDIVADVTEKVRDGVQAIDF